MLNNHDKIIGLIFIWSFIINNCLESIEYRKKHTKLKMKNIHLNISLKIIFYKKLIKICKVYKITRRFA